MSKQLPNERPPSEYPDPDRFVVVRTTWPDYPIIAGRVCGAMMRGFWVGSEDIEIPWSSVLGWQYQNNDLLVDAESSNAALRAKVAEMREALNMVNSKALDVHEPWHSQFYVLFTPEEHEVIQAALSEERT